MRRRIASALALGALAGLGGCATQQPRRSEGPSQYLGWTAPAGSAAASGSTPTPAPAKPAGPISALIARVSGSPTPSPASTSSPAPSGPIAAMIARSSRSKSPASDAWPPQDDATAKAAAPAASRTAPGATAGAMNDIPPTAVRPRYKPGSWLFRRLAKPEPAPARAHPADPTGSLARYFPTLYNKGPADAARVARASRPTGGDRSATLAASSVEMTRNTVGGAEIEPPLLADGLDVRPYPKPPSPSLPPQESVARRGDPAPAPAGEQLTSHEAEAEADAEAGPAASPRPRGDLIDALSTRLDREPPAPRASSRPDPDDAPSDPAGRPTSATVEVPARASDRPAGLLVASSVPEGESKPEAAGAPLPGGDLIATLLALPNVAPTAPEPARPDVRPSEPPAPAPAPATAPRPRTVLRADAIDLPAPEFPATYHTDSLRQVAREAPRSGPGREVVIEPEPRKPLLPRLSRLLWGHDEAKDRPSARTEPRDVAERR